MQQKLMKTIRTKILALTKVKQEKLSLEYAEFQKVLRGEPAQLYSATRQQAERVRHRIRKKGGRRIREEHPLIIRRDCIKIKYNETRLFHWWARVPVYGGSIWVPVALPRKYEELLSEGSIRETKLVKHGQNWYLHIAVEKDVWVELPQDPAKIVVIGVDLGEVNPAASVALLGEKKRIVNARLYGKELRGIRTRYAHIRKQVGKRKTRHALRVIKHICAREARIAREVCHRISATVVEEARLLRSEGFQVAIAVGDLKYVRKQRIKGLRRCRKNNRKIAQMPFNKLKSFLSYKSVEAGVPIFFVLEANTSRTCHLCGSKSAAAHKRSFKCLDCGLEHNRDLNAAINIANRLLGYIPLSRGSSDAPEPPQSTVAQNYPVHTIATSACDGGNLKKRFDTELQAFGSGRTSEVSRSSKTA